MKLNFNFGLLTALVILLLTAYVRANPPIEQDTGFKRAGGQSTVISMDYSKISQAYVLVEDSSENPYEIAINRQVHPNDAILVIKTQNARILYNYPFQRPERDPVRYEELRE